MSFFGSVGGFVLGIGTTVASFQLLGTDPCLMEALKIDAGNWLFKYTNLNQDSSDYELNKARLQAEAYAEIGYHAINVCHTDLLPGEDFISELENNYKLPFISANVLDKRGNLRFLPFKVLSINGLRIGVTGIITN